MEELSAFEKYTRMVQEKSLEEGLEKGRAEGREETARNMLQRRMGAELVSQVTGLDLPRVLELAGSLGADGGTRTA